MSGWILVTFDICLFLHELRTFFALTDGVFVFREAGSLAANEATESDAKGDESISAARPRPVRRSPDRRSLGSQKLDVKLSGRCRRFESN